MLGLDPSISGQEDALTGMRFSGLRYASPENDGLPQTLLHSAGCVTGGICLLPRNQPPSFTSPSDSLSM